MQPTLDAQELSAVGKVFDSHWLGRGDVTAAFEKAFAQHLLVPVENLTTISTCTEALFLSMRLLGIGEGDDVVLPSISFVGAANAIRAAGAHPVFCDVDAHSLNTTLAMIQESLTMRTRAVILLHYGGWPCNELNEIAKFLETTGIFLIEDSACSLATKVGGKATGTFGDIGCWSFDAMKVITMGNGGAIYCADRRMAQRARSLTFLGLTTQSGFGIGADTRWWEFDVADFGRNATIDDLRAAIGLAQLSKIGQLIERRKQVHERYNARLADVEWLRLPPETKSDGAEQQFRIVPSYYFYWIQTRDRRVSRDGLAKYLRKHDVYTTFRYYPLHFVEIYNCGYSLPHTEWAAANTLLLPQHAGLSDDDVDKICELVRRYGKY